MYLRRKDGQEFPVEISLGPFQIGSEQFIVSTICDLTERQREAEIRRRVEHLALLGTLAASVSHELRNPLSTVFLQVDIITEELRTPTPESPLEVASALAVIRAELDRMQDLVQDYLILARLASAPREPIILVPLWRHSPRSWRPR